VARLQENVLGLDVSMHHVALVGVGQTLGHVATDLHRVGDWKS